MGNFNDGDILHRSCVESCEKSGCVDDSCFNSCKFPAGIDPEGDPSLTKSLDSAYELFLKEPLYLRWKKWDCTSECRYQCMVREEAKRESDGQLPLKYHGKWPFVRFFSLQEPASVAFSVLNLLVHFQGFSSFLVLVFYKLPLSAHGSPHYEYVSLWAIYGLLSMNSWIWSTVFHSRLVHVTSSFSFDSNPHMVELPTRSSELTETPGRLETFSTHVMVVWHWPKWTQQFTFKICSFVGLAMWAAGASFRL
jgi:hypothetical protein